MLEAVLRQDTSDSALTAEGASPGEGNEDAIVPNPVGGEAAPAPKVHESVEALQKDDPIAVRCVSEVAGVELLKTASGKLFVVAEKKRIVPKLTLLGGFGTGKQLEFDLFRVRSFFTGCVFSFPAFSWVFLLPDRQFLIQVRSLFRAH